MIDQVWLYRPLRIFFFFFFFKDTGMLNFMILQSNTPCFETLVNFLFFIFLRITYQSWIGNYIFDLGWPIVKRLMLDIPTFLQKILQTIDMARLNWQLYFWFWVAYSQKINARDTNFFTKNFTNCWYGEWLLVNEKMILMMDLDENQ